MHGKGHKGEVFLIRRQSRGLVKEQTKSENLELKYERERSYQQEMHEKQRPGEEKFDAAELEPTQEKLKIQRTARAPTASFAKLIGSVL